MTCPDCKRPKGLMGSQAGKCFAWTNSPVLAIDCLRAQLATVAAERDGAFAAAAHATATEKRAIDLLTELHVQVRTALGADDQTEDTAEAALRVRRERDDAQSQVVEAVKQRDEAGAREQADTEKLRDFFAWAEELKRCDGAVCAYCRAPVALDGMAAHILGCPEQSKSPIISSLREEIHVALVLLRRCLDELRNYEADASGYEAPDGIDDLRALIADVEAHNGAKR